MIQQKKFMHLLLLQANIVVSENRLNIYLPECFFSTNTKIHQDRFMTFHSPSPTTGRVNNIINQNYNVFKDSQPSLKITSNNLSSLSLSQTTPLESHSNPSSLSTISTPNTTPSLSFAAVLCSPTISSSPKTVPVSSSPKTIPISHETNSQTSPHSHTNKNASQIGDLIRGGLPQYSFIILLF
jgi:hypothetical protein